MVVLFITGSLLLVLFAFSQGRSTTPETTEAAPSKPAPFRWRFVVLPLTICLLTVAMTAWFYGRLPLEVATRFSSDGSPLGTSTRATVVMWALLPQLLLTMLAFAVAWGATRISALARSVQGAAFSMDTLLLLMGNMVALPQLILGFAMLNTFSYNAYQVRPVPLWTVVIIVAIAGAGIIGAFFISLIRKAMAGNK